MQRVRSKIRVFFLASVIDVKIAKTDTSFLTSEALST